MDNRRTTIEDEKEAFDTALSQVDWEPPTRKRLAIVLTDGDVLVMDRAFYRVQGEVSVYADEHTIDCKEGSLMEVAPEATIGIPSSRFYNIEDI